MGITASANWSIQGRDGSHAIAAQIAKGWALVFTITVDGVQIVELKKQSMLPIWKTQHSLRIGQHAGLLKVLRKGYGGTQFELIVDGKLAAPNQHTVIDSPAPAYAPTPQVIYAQPPPQVVVNQAPAQGSGPTPVMPVLPPKCPNCGTPISMETVKWTGPISARCPSCDNSIQVEWRKLGG